MKIHAYFIAMCICLSTLFFTASNAQWEDNGVAVQATSIEERPQVIVTDDAGGAWILNYMPADGGDYSAVYHLDASGFVPWNTSIDCSRWEMSHHMIPDASGGVFWAIGGLATGGSQEICQGRIEPDGSGTLFGFTCCEWGCLVSGTDICQDGMGGAIFAWHERNDSTYSIDIKAQRVDAAGVKYWDACDVGVCANGMDHFWPRITVDGAGGAVIVWSRAGELYAQRVDQNGTIMWLADGVPICTGTGIRDWFEIVTDGLGGAIIVWHDSRTVEYDIYAQRIGANGSVKWTANGVAVCSATNNQKNPSVIPDGAGGAILAWNDYRYGEYDLYAQRIDSLGSSMWTADGEVVCEASGTQNWHSITSDGVDGAIIAWSDGRDSDSDVYVQRMDGAGNALWADSGVVVCSAMGDQERIVITSDGTYGAIVAWQDFRSDTLGDVYAQRITASGTPVGINDHHSVPAKRLRLHQNIPNPFNPVTFINFSLPEQSRVTLTIYDTGGRLVARILDRVEEGGPHTATWNGCDTRGTEVGSGIYYARLSAAGETSVIKMVLLR